MGGENTLSNDLTITVQHNALKGAVAQNMDLDTYGECAHEGDCDNGECDPGRNSMDCSGGGDPGHGGDLGDGGGDPGHGDGQDDDDDATYTPTNPNTCQSCEFAIPPPTFIPNPPPELIPTNGGSGGSKNASLPNYVSGNDASSFFTYNTWYNGFVTDPYGNVQAVYQIDPNTGGYYQIPYAPPPADPCADHTASNKASDLYNNANVKSSMDNLAGLTNLSNESAATISMDTRDNNRIGVSSIVGGTGNQVMPPDFNDPGYPPLGTAHTHPASSASSGLTTVMPPSAADLYYTAAQNAKYPSYQSSYIIGADGSKYALTVSDPTALAQFMALWPPATNLDPNTNGFTRSNPPSNTNCIGDVFNRAMLDFGADVPNADIAYQDAFAFVLKQYNIGITLSKMGSDGNFHKVSDTSVPAPNSTPANPTWTHSSVICP